MGRREKRMRMEEDILFSNFRRRMEFVAALFLVLILLLLLRLAYIQIGCHDEFTAAANEQYKMPIIGLDEGYRYYCIIEKEKADDNLHRLLVGEKARDISKESSRYAVYEMKTLDCKLGKFLKEQYHAYTFRNYAPQSLLILRADAAGRILPGLRPEPRART